MIQNVYAAATRNAPILVQKAENLTKVRELLKEYILANAVRPSTEVYHQCAVTPWITPGKVAAFDAMASFIIGQCRLHMPGAAAMFSQLRAAVMWGNYYRPGDHCDWHRHDLSAFTATYIVDNPDLQGSYQVRGAENNTGWNSVTGLLIIHPGWVEHRVNPGATNRISANFLIRT